VSNDLPVPRLSISLRSVGSDGQDSSISASDVNFGSYIPEGEYKIEVRDLPQSFYRVKAISYGTVDLLVEPLRVKGEPRPNDEIVVTLEALPEMPAVRVSGKVVNSMNDGTETPRQIMLYDTRRWSLTTTVGPDGRFEFSKVPPGSYAVGTVPHIESPTRGVTVSTEDLRDLEIILPRKREVRGRIRVEGGYPLPTARLLVGLNGMTPQVYPPSSEEPKIQSDGTFVMTIPEGEHRVDVDHSPHYRVKSIRQGSSDLLKQPLKIAGNNPREIIVTLEAVAPPAWVSVRGRLGGIDRLPPGVDSVRAVLTKMLSPITLETRLNSRGEFRFPKVPPGTYTLRTEPQVAGMTHKTVVVTDGNLSGVELVVPQQRLVTVRAKVDGATSIPGFSLILTENNGRAYRVLTNWFIAMVLDRRDFWCVTDVCSPAPLGLALNDPKSSAAWAPNASSPCHSPKASTVWRSSFRKRTSFSRSLSALPIF
jgi:hypothetical protein